MYSYLLTARCHPADVPYFEEFLPIFFTKFCQNEYYWTIEKDGTCDRHLHYLSRGENPKDIERVVNKFNAKIFQEFKNRLKDSDTLWIDKITNDNPGQGFLNIKTVPKEEFGLTLGYILKEAPARRYTGKLEPDEIENYINLHYINERNKAKARDPELQSLKILSGRSMVPKVYDYCKRTGTRFDNPELYYLMVQNGYFFGNISSKVRARLFRELRVHTKQELQLNGINLQSEDRRILNSEMSDDYEASEDTGQWEDIIKLLKIIKMLELEVYIASENSPPHATANLKNWLNVIKHICCKNHLDWSNLEQY